MGSAAGPIALQTIEIDIMNCPAAASLLLLVVATGQAQAEAVETLEDLIAQVEKQEALFRNLDAVIKTSWTFHPQPEKQPGGIMGDAHVWDSIEATVHQVTRGAELSCSRE